MSRQTTQQPGQVAASLAIRWRKFAESLPIYHWNETKFMQEALRMNMIYNSQHYCVVEFAAYGDLLNAQGGFEIMDKAGRREIFIEGALADRFRDEVAELVECERTEEEVDEYLSSFEFLMRQPLALH